MFFGQNSNTLHLMARHRQTGWINWQFSNADVVSARGKQAAHDVGVACKQLHPNARTLSVRPPSAWKAGASAVGRTLLPVRSNNANPTSSLSRDSCTLTAGCV